MSGPAAALGWLDRQEAHGGGILVHPRANLAYPEVTGYLVTTLLQYGHRDLTQRLVRWLLSTQRADGGYASPGNVPHVFDTGQVLRGLLAVAGSVPGALAAAERTADFLCAQAIDRGAGGFGGRYRGAIPESVHLYVLPPLIAAANALSRADYREVAERCLEYYLSAPDTLRTDDLTHFLAYELDALIDLDQAERVLPLLDALGNEQGSDGSVRGRGGVRWVCTPGLAQLAVCWYKTGRWQAGDKAVAWLEAHQESSGGFKGSYGRGAHYFSDREIPWAAKFYLDANLLRVRAFFARNAHALPIDVGPNDGRLQAVLAHVGASDSILEVGCGKGRFLRAVRKVRPYVRCTGVDLSADLLAYVPEGIDRVEAAAELVPLPDDSFDVVFSIEAIEHSANQPAAIAEMIRTAKPGGWVIVVDKHQGQWGRLECPPWETWPRVSAIKNLLWFGCDDVTAEPVAYDDRPATDGLMMVWRGRKRSMLTGAEWSEVLISQGARDIQVERIRRNDLTKWAEAISLATTPGQRVLEVASGTGEITLHLARGGREVTALDVSQTSLAFVHACARQLGVRLNTVRADALRPLPFVDQTFDCTWSSGLLEHFPAAQRRAILAECARVSCGMVISLIPNGACVAYRAGKRSLEEAGRWRYGLELALTSQREDFEAAGLCVVSERSIAPLQALEFLERDSALHQGMLAWLKRVSEEEACAAQQGYLLMTVGKPR